MSPAALLKRPVLKHKLTGNVNAGALRTVSQLHTETVATNSLAIFTPEQLFCRQYFT